MSVAVQGTQIEVTVVYASAPNALWRRVVQLTVPATVTDVLVLSGFAQSFPSVDWQMAGVGLFGRKCTPEEPVYAGAQVEVYRPLNFDPMQSRRRRAAHRKAQALANKKPRIKIKRPQ